MKHFRKIWDKEKHDFILKNKELPRKELYELFLKQFPEASDVTFTAFCNERSRIKAASRVNVYHRSRKAKPLFSEHVKKDYVLIKIAQPSVWIFKHWYIWNQTHPENTVIPKKEVVVFLDLDNRNFNPDNLLKVSRSLIVRINNGKFGKLEKGNAEHNRLVIKLAEMEKLIFDRGEQFGLISNYGRCRIFREKANKNARNFMRNLSEEKKAEYKEKRIKKYQELKKNTEAYEEHKRKQREYKRKRKELNNADN